MNRIKAGKIVIDNFVKPPPELPEARSFSSFRPKPTFTEVKEDKSTTPINAEGWRAQKGGRVSSFQQDMLSNNE